MKAKTADRLGRAWPAGAVVPPAGGSGGAPEGEGVRGQMGQGELGQGQVGRGRMWLWGMVGLICVLVGAVYANSVRNGFHLDDTYGLVENPWVRSLGHVPRYFVDPGTLTTHLVNIDYRPLLQVSYAVNYAVSGYDPWSWHATNMIMHAWVSVCVLMLGRLLVGRGRVVPVRWLGEREGDWAAAAGAVLFAVHPVCAGAVNYMWARSSLMTAVFVMPAVVIYLRGLRGGGSAGNWRRAMPAVLGLYAASMLTKSEGVTLLGAAALAEILLNPRRQQEPLWRRALHADVWLRLGPMAAMFAGYMVLREKMLPPGHFEQWTLEDMTRWKYLMTQVTAWWYYLGQVAAPVRLIADHTEYPVIERVWDGRLLLALAGWGVVGTVLLAAARAWPGMVFVAGCYFVHLSPHSSVMPLAEMVNEHRPYLPLAGLFVAIGVGTWWVGRVIGSGMREGTRARMVGGKVAWAGAVAVLVAVLGVMTAQRNTVFRDDLTYWSDVVAKTPRSARANMNYGIALMARGRLAEAEEAFSATLRYEPNWNFAHINMAIAAWRQGRAAEAARYYDQAVLSTPEHPRPYFYRALFRAFQGDAKGAEGDYARSLELSPNATDVLSAYAEFLWRAGRAREAEVVIRRGEAIDREGFAALRARLTGSGGGGP